MSHKSCGTVGIKELLNRCTWREAAFRKEALLMKMGFVAFARLYLEMRTLDGACTLIEKEKKVIQISSKKEKRDKCQKGVHTCARIKLKNASERSSVSF